MRVYTITTKVSQECTVTEIERHTWLFINDTREEDVTDYVCESFSRVLQPFPPKKFPSSERVSTTAGKASF